MDNIPKYNGTVHPEDWAKQVQTKCLMNNIRQERDVLKICKLNIAESIKFPNEVNSINELTKALKAHSTFDIYKNNLKQRLESMKFEGGEGGDTAQFLAECRSLINQAEITNPQDVKHRLLRTYESNEFFKNEFIKRATGVTSIDEIFRLYSEVVSDMTKIIKYNPEMLITIRHVETGRYLSSIEKVNYKSGSQRQVVFAGEKIPNENAWWFLSCATPIQKEKFQENKVFYEDVVYLTHKKTGDTIYLTDFYRSPKTGHAEVHCFPYAYTSMRFVKTDQTNQNNKTPYLKSRDRVYLKSDGDYILRSQDVTFEINDKSYQEVVGHKEKVGRDDEWQIEIK